MFGRNRFAARKDAGKYGKRHKPGEMNQTESEYAGILQVRKIRGEIQEWRFESTTLRLADRTTYTPDFEILHNDGSKEFVDVKGGGPISDTSKVKIKCCAERFWEFSFSIQQKMSKKNGGHWQRTEY